MKKILALIIGSFSLSIIFAVLAIQQGPVLIAFKYVPTNANDISIVMDAPSAPHSSPVFGLVAGPRFALEFQSELGLFYRVQVSTNQSIWKMMPARLAGTGGILRYYDTIDDLKVPKYYRIMVE